MVFQKWFSHSKTLGSPDENIEDLKRHSEVRGDDLTEKDLVVSEKKMWKTIVKFCRAHPEIFTRGVPLAMVAYFSFPLFFMMIKYLPWIWAGYQVYSTIPRRYLMALYLAITAYMKS